MLKCPDTKSSTDSKHSLKCLDTKSSADGRLSLKCPDTKTSVLYLLDKTSRLEQSRYHLSKTEHGIQNILWGHTDFKVEKDDNSIFSTYIHICPFYTRIPFL